MLMVESKQRRARLGGAATPSPVPSPGPGLASSSSELKSSEEWNEMRPSQLGRIDVLQLKAEIVKRIGSDRADRYFAHFRSFISSQASKQELDKLVLLTIGKENVALHNQLVKAILHNAVRAQGPPPLPSQDASNPFKRTHQKPLSFICNEEAASQAVPPSLSNGDSIVRSPRRRRLHTLRDHVDRPSPLGSREENVADLSRPIQQFEGVTKQQEAESGGGVVPPSKRLRGSQPVTADMAIALESKKPDVENRITKEDGQEDYLRPAGGFAQELLGRSFCSGRVSTAGKPTLLSYPAPLLIHELSGDNSVDATDLPDADIMHKRMEEIAAAEGLESVRKDCADLLNNALDSFLGRLIKSCVDVGFRQVDDGRPVLSGPSWEKNATMSNSSTPKPPRPINGVWSGSSVDLSRMNKEKVRPAISLTDFKVAMDLDPKQLGEDWPVQLEKISFRLFDQ